LFTSRSASDPNPAEEDGPVHCHLLGREGSVESSSRACPQERSASSLTWSASTRKEPLPGRTVASRQATVASWADYPVCLIAGAAPGSASPLTATPAESGKSQGHERSQPPNRDTPARASLRSDVRITIRTPSYLALQQLLKDQGSLCAYRLRAPVRGPAAVAEPDRKRWREFVIVESLFEEAGLGAGLLASGSADICACVLSCRIKDCADWLGDSPLGVAPLEGESELQS
jgi:hypothetical protein